MPSVVNGVRKSTNGKIAVNRSESLRSEISDASAQSKRVSFNNDVKIRRIPRGGIVHGQLVAVIDSSSAHEPQNKNPSSDVSLWINSEAKDSELLQKELLKEAETILRNVDKIQCSSAESPSNVHNNNRLFRSKSELNKAKPTSIFSFKRANKISKVPNSEIVSSSSVTDLRKVGNLANSFSDLRSSVSPSREANQRVSKIKKSPRRRLGLNSIGESDLSSSSESSARKNFLSSEESPLSSLSSAEGEKMSRFTSTTHNNNQPFSYTNFKNPLSREIIYAQVVAGEKDKDGQSAGKHTVHKKYNEINNDKNYSHFEESSTNGPIIHHMVYDKENWKNNEGNDSTNDWKYNNESWRNSESLLSNYNKKNNEFGSRNNVTTVLLNSNDDEDSLRSGTISYERPFFYGDSLGLSNSSTKNGHSFNKPFDHHSSSSSPQFAYSSSSREQSPARNYLQNFPKTPLNGSAKFIENAEKRHLISSATLSNKIPPKAHTNYNYMSEKLGYLTPSENSYNGHKNYESEKKYLYSNRKNGDSYERSSSSPPRLRTGINTTDNFKISRVPMQRQLINDYGSHKKSPPSGVFEKNIKNNSKMVKNDEKNGHGLISTLMRRNKKISKDKKLDGTTKVKPRNKFLALFFDNSSSSSAPGSNKKNGVDTKKRLNGMTTDSEIEDAERKRDGEYHSWSSVDGAYQSYDRNNSNQPTRTQHFSPKEKLTRVKSHNFGNSRDNYRQESEERWYDARDSDDYRRDLAAPFSTNYKSATLGRPNLMSKSDKGPNSASRTKSLDRRNVQKSPPKIVITPNSPPVVENDFEWSRNNGANYNGTSKYAKNSPYKYNDYGENGDNEIEPVKNKLVSKLSQSSIELAHNRFDEGDGKLRYFGDTDLEDRLVAKNSNGVQRGGSKLTNGGTGGTHVSRRDTALRKFRRNDGSSEESESRMSKGSSTNGSKRSVYLHAPTVAEIPPPSGLSRRTLSKDEISNHSGSQKQSRTLARSMSVLAPWRPRPAREKYELHYDENTSKNKKPPKPPRSPNRKSSSPGPSGMYKKRSESSENLITKEPKIPPPPRPKQPSWNKIAHSSSTLGRDSSNKRGNSSAITRSKSIPNDTLFTSWLSRRRERNPPDSLRE